MQSALGQREAALASTQEAVEHYRGLAKARPDAFLPDLAMSLNNLGTMQSDLGSAKQRWRRRRRRWSIIERWRRPVRTRFLPDLAASITTWALRRAISAARGSAGVDAGGGGALSSAGEGPSGRILAGSCDEPQQTWV
jgi:hypothetical protein